MAPWLEATVEAHPWLSGAAEPAEARRQKAVLQRLLSLPLAQGLLDSTPGIALAPGSREAVYVSAALERYLTPEEAASGVLSGEAWSELDEARRYALVCRLAEAAYGLEGCPALRPIVTLKDPETGLNHYFAAELDFRLVRFAPQGAAPALDAAQAEALQAALQNGAAAPPHLALEGFRAEGIELLRFVDITEEHALSLLKGDLLEGERGALAQLVGIFEGRVRDYLGKPEVFLGLAATQGDTLRPLRTAAGAADPFRPERLDPARLGGTFIGRALSEGKPQLVCDLAAEGSGDLERELAGAGVRAAIVAPLNHRSSLTGLLYLWSPRPNALALRDLALLDRVLPLCAAAVNRSKEELNYRVQSVILSEYTAIHPSVEWRFRKAALNYIRRHDRGLRAEAEPIVFDEVYPLYGVADIRASSAHRNEAVKHDLHEHLTEVEDILQLARTAKPLPILNYLAAQAEANRRMLEDGLSSDEEAGIKDFISRHIEPLLDHLTTFGPAVAERVEAYRADAQVESGRLYRQCRAFDQSVSLLNQTISGYLDAEEARAQAMFPHYFEKRQTDGVEFSIYVGASLVEDIPFNPLYVRNLRLWQLMVMCGIARLAAPLKERMEMPLETTQLVIAHSAPLSIRFQLSETRFDVDGTHHIRYEIMKRRLEKAQLKGADERLTQPGKIAIVYSQFREAWEYEEYIRFLQSAGYLAPEIEEVEISDLQGISGLKALRVNVLLESGAGGDGLSSEVIERAVAAMPLEPF